MRQRRQSTYTSITEMANFSGIRRELGRKSGVRNARPRNFQTPTTARIHGIGRYRERFRATRMPRMDHGPGKATLCRRTSLYNQSQLASNNRWSHNPSQLRRRTMDRCPPSWRGETADPFWATRPTPSRDRPKISAYPAPSFRRSFPVGTAKP